MKKIIIFLLIGWCLSPVSAQAVKFSNLNGQEFSYQELVSAPKTVFLAWAVWCPYCRRELERVSKKCIFFEEVEIFFINIGESKSTVEKFANSKGFKDCIREKIILDHDSLIAQEFGIIGIPTYIFFKDGEQLQKSYFLNQELLETVFGPE